LERVKSAIVVSNFGNNFQKDERSLHARMNNNVEPKKPTTKSVINNSRKKRDLPTTAKQKTKRRFHI